jgi:hypothetical protein
MKVKKLWFDGEKFSSLLMTEENCGNRMLWYPRLLNASPEQRQNYEIDNSGIRWEDVDEDMSLDSFLYDDPNL